MKHESAIKRARRSRTSGYTIIELMIVVGIIGVLAAIAIPTFGDYLMRSKTTEAVTFLAEIRQRQESYRSEFGMYCNVSGTATTYHPTADPGRNAIAWTTTDPWTQLGARPDGRVRFAYSTVARPPGAAFLPASAGFTSDLGYTGTDFWFVSRALGDLDGDNANVIFESYSESAGIWISEQRGWE